MKKRNSFIFLTLLALASALVLSACTIGGSGADVGGGEEPPHEHEFGEYVEKIPASCTEDGVLGHYTCTVCGVNCDKDGKELSSLVIERDWPHEFVDEVCEKCGEELVYSEGLKFTLSYDKSYYILSGIGSSTDLDIVIPPVYNNVPVKEIGSAAFRRDYNITSVLIPYTVTKIGAYAFSDCASLENVSFEDASELETIDVSAFEYCRSLKSFVIQESVSTIGDYAFRTCSSLASVRIPENVISIGYEAFLDCESLAAIDVDEYNTEYKSINGNLYDYEALTLLQYAIGKTAIYFEIPEGVKEIGESAFENCKSLMNVTLPDSVKTIGARAFDNCKNLEGVTLGDGVESIGDYAFEYCENLIKISIPDGVESIGYRAFDSCVKLRVFVIPASVTEIGDYAFSLCTGLTSIEVDDNNPNYSDIDGNLYNKDATELIQYATGKTEVSFSIPESVTDICRWVFSGCKSLESIEIPESVTTIGDYAFENCLGLKTIEIPESVTRIGDYSFSSCTSLTYVGMPKSVESFGNYAFIDCSSLETIKYGATRADWVNIIKGYEWDDNTGLYIITYNYDGIESEIQVDENGFQFIVSDGVNYLLGYEGTKSELSLPKDFNGENYVIAKYAFYQNSRLTRVTIPASVIGIEEAAFFECTSLKRVNFASGAKLNYIGASVFEGCSSLTNIWIPTTVVSIGDSAFASCEVLPTITIPKNVETIGNKAFYECKNLASVVFSTSKLDAIKSYTFYGCVALTEITLPTSVTEIGSFAFYDCSLLQTVNMLGALEEIGDSAFYYCTGLLNINFAGDEKSWEAIVRGTDWDFYTGNYTVNYNYSE